jgi:fumarate hydratase class II
MRAPGLVKKAAVEANLELGLLTSSMGRAIALASQEVIDGQGNLY